MKNYIFLGAKLLLAFHLAIFGLNKFLMFAHIPPPQDATAQIFLGTMFTSYLAKLVGTTQILGSILLIIPRTSFIGFLLLTPVVINIISFHLAHDFIGNGLWLFTSFLYGIVAHSKKEKIQSLIEV